MFGYLNDIRLLSAVRNVLIHSGGKIDLEFSKQTVKFKDTLKINQLGEISIDAALVIRLLKASIETASDLLTATNKAYNK